jgi:hypothetical protein
MNSTVNKPAVVLNRAVVRQIVAFLAANPGASDDQIENGLAPDSHMRQRLIRRNVRGLEVLGAVTWGGTDPMSHRSFANGWVNHS